MTTLIKSLLVAFTLTLLSFSVSQAEINKPKKTASFQSGIYTTTEGEVRV